MLKKAYFCVIKFLAMNNAIVDKIKKLRISKGFNHNDMVDKLHITRSAYQRLENGETYSWAKYLEELLGILETNQKDFFSDIGSKIYNQTNNTGGIGYIVENLHQENKEVYEKLIASKDDQIALLKSLLDKRD
jgi:transcriptional regulator with XRE-family HTH domain